jgi:hypothetical protein
VERGRVGAIRPTGLEGEADNAASDEMGGVGSFAFDCGVPT